MEYFQKIEQNPYEDLFWNVPERARGTVNVVGGNVQNFQTVVRTGEFLAGHYPLEEVGVVLPEALKNKVPELTNFKFLPATESGAFNGEQMVETLEGVDYNLLIGDLSKNTVTKMAVQRCLTEVERPVLVTRDAVDLVTEGNPEAILMKKNIGFLATAQQLQKLLRAVYYPKVMTLSQSLLQIAEILHKFTLSYQVGVVTFYSNQILVAKEGKVVAVPIEKSGFSPFTIWGGQMAAKMVAVNVYNPGQFLEASVAAIFQEVPPVV